MRQILPFLLLVALIACQSNEPDSFGIDPQLNQYSDDASMTQKLFCNPVNCENPSSQEIYTYHSDGRLNRIDYYFQTGTGKLDRISYTDYHYTPTGQLSGIIRYGKNNVDSKWTATEESEYIYLNSVLSLQRTYYNQYSPQQRILTSVIEFEIKDGKKTGQRWYDAQHNLTRRVMYAYRNNTLVNETWYNATDNVIRRFEHRFAGNRRQIGEYVPNISGQVSMVEKIYDAQGRLSSEQTKVINPLLCAMQAGVIRYVY